MCKISRKKVAMSFKRFSLLATIFFAILVYVYVSITMRSTCRCVSPSFNVTRQVGIGSTLTITEKTIKPQNEGRDRVNNLVVPETTSNLQNSFYTLWSFILQG